MNLISLDRLQTKQLNQKITKALRGAIATPPEYVYPKPDMVLGGDFHQYSGKVDFDKAVEAGMDFTLIKVTHGMNKSRFFDENWKGSEGKLPRGAWHWLYPSNIFSSNRQARNVYDIMKNAGLGEIPLQVDFEWTNHNYKKANPTANDLYGFCETYADLAGYRPIIYTAQGYWNEFGSRSDYWKQYRGWIANYGVSKPNVPAPFTKWTFWQFTDMGFGEQYGVNKYEERGIDLNYYNGTKAEFNAEFGLAAETPPEVKVCPCCNRPL